MKLSNLIVGGVYSYVVHDYHAVVEIIAQHDYQNYIVKLLKSNAKDDELNKLYTYSIIGNWTLLDDDDDDIYDKLEKMLQS